MIDTALAYIERGWKIFPLHSIVNGRCSCSKPVCTNQGKHPRTLNGVKDATDDRDAILNWWSIWADANIGIACGAASGIVVIDVDPRHGGFETLDAYEEQRPDGPLPDTLKTITGSGGRHLVYRYPQDGEKVGNRNGWKQGLDVRGDGGYIVAPPSNHESGGYYSWQNEGHEVVDLPADVLAELRSGGALSSREDLPDSTSILQGVAEGKRDDLLFRTACRWRRQFAKEPDGGRAIVTLLVMEAAKNCNPPFPEVEARVKIESAFKQDHSDEAFSDVGPDEDEGGRRHLSDDGNALRLVDANQDDLRYTPALGWLVWDGTRWTTDAQDVLLARARDVHEIVAKEADMTDDNETATRIRKWSHQSESSGHISAMIKLAQSDERINRKFEDFDSDPYLLNCRNGVVDLRTGLLIPHVREQLMTLSTNVDYDPSFRLDSWDAFIESSCEGDIELMTYMQRAAGYTLLGVTEAEAFFIIHGPAASGKSTFIDGLNTALGDYAVITATDTLMMQKGGAQTPKDELARMAGKRMVTATESGEGDRMNEALIKQMTGGDRITGRHLYRDAFTFKPQFALWLATNHTPSVRDAAIFRRIRKIPFTHAVPVERRDKQLKIDISDPEKGGKAVLAWAVRGAMSYIELRELAEPARVQQETDLYQRDQDRLGAFVDDDLVQSEGGELLMRTAFQRYVAWCQGMNERPMAFMAFQTRMKDRPGMRWRQEGHRVFIVGWALRDNASSGWEAFGAG